jgi:hypothetical protein
MEKATIQQVGSYGKQVGHLAEALEIVMKQLKLLDSKGLSQDGMHALQVFHGDVAAVGGVKAKQTLVRARNSNFDHRGGALGLTTLCGP